LKSSFFKGMRLSVPLALGFIPIGCSFAVMAMQAGLTGFETVFMSFFVLSGASQIMAVGMLSQGAGFAAIVLASAFMTMRHLVLSSSVMRRLGKLSTVQKIVASYALCDESFAVFSLSEEKNFPFLMGCNTLFCATWIASTALGCVLNNFLPPIVADSCAIAFYAAFLAMLVPVVRKSLPILLLVLLTGGVNALLQLVLPSSWAVVCSMVVCAAIGTFFVPMESKEGEKT
jgi:predicted branched-subunit amino acid permease